MKDYDSLKHHPMVETLVDILSARTQNPDKNFFTILSCYHLTKLASMMRCRVDAKGFGNLNVNFYGLNAAPSGAGKGYSTKIIEEQVLHLFKQNFMEFTLPTIAEKSLAALAIKRAIRKGVDEAEELEAVTAEFRKLGVYLTSFDSGTTPAIKQFRHQLLMSEVGSINLEIDEMANNLLGNKEVLDAYLELFDGTIKPKLTKNTNESTRNEEIEGKTPTNMLMFGTASTLLDGGPVEKALIDMLTTGYSRRCFFGYSGVERAHLNLSVEDRLKQLTDSSSDVQLATIAKKLEKLSDPVNHNFQVSIPDDVMRAIIEYQIYCEGLMDNMKLSDEIRRAEARGRYFKTIKLAGAYAFLDSQSKMTLAHWEAAVKVAEMSANCFNLLLTRDPAHARLAKHLAECSTPVTMADLIEELPYFPKSGAPQKDMIKHAIAWGYRNNVVIKRHYVDDIEFIQGDSLKEVTLDKLRLSHSHDVAEGYTPESKVPFEKLELITKRPNWHWCNHHFVDGKRRQTHVIQGFNLIVIDVDGTATIEQAQSVLKDYTYHIYTTKRHTPDVHRFRIVIPMSHQLKLSIEEYKAFMDNVLEFLPFETDEQTSQANRKWLSNENAQVFNNEGALFDVLPFIPKTRKSEEFKKYIEENSNLDSLERFFFRTISEGNRSNTLIRYAFALIDAGHELDAAVEKLKQFNSKIPKPLPVDELASTVIQSMTKKFFQKGGN